MQYTIHAAKTHLSKLVAAAEAGEEVVLARGAKPVAMIVPIPPKKREFKFGILPKELGDTMPDFLEPMSEEELLDWEGRD